jgi:hypothetical protein
VPAAEAATAAERRAAKRGSIEHVADVLDALEARALLDYDLLVAGGRGLAAVIAATARKAEGRQRHRQSQPEIGATVRALLLTIAAPRPLLSPPVVSFGPPPRFPHPKNRDPVLSRNRLEITQRGRGGRILLTRSVLSQRPARSSHARGPGAPQAGREFCQRRRPTTASPPKGGTPRGACGTPALSQRSARRLARQAAPRPSRTS